MKERREFVRVVSDLKLRYTLLDEGRVSQSSAQEIGGGGLRFITNEKVKKGQRMALEIDVPGASRAVMAEAEVVWAQNIGGSCREVGTRFTRIDRRDQAKILKYVYDAAKT